MLSTKRLSYDDPAGIADAVLVRNEVLAHDEPGLPQSTPQMMAMWMRHPRYGSQVELHVAYSGDEPIGLLEFYLPQLDNTQNVNFDLAVRPAFRRRGYGRELFQHVLKRTRELGRSTILTGTALELPGIPRHDGGAGSAFAKAMELENANLPEVLRQIDLSTLDNAVLDEMLSAAQAKSGGYKLVQWMGAAPEELVDDVAYLDGRLIEDAPMGDLAIEPEKVDAERVRNSEAAREARGQMTYHTGAMHEESGKLVAWTTIGVDPEVDWHAWQYITIVEPTHRGHRLGALVKVANLRYVQEHATTVKKITTGNAAENSYMISINDSMGFRPLLAFENWQVTLRKD